MMRAVADLLSFYQYDETVLSELVLPEGVDRTVLINNLLMETSELEILYPDFDFLKGAIGAWSSKELPVWTELLETTQYEYEPLWNKDYRTDHTETRNLAGTEDVSRNMDDDNTYSGTNQSSAETLNSVYGYNSSTDAPADKANSSASSTTGSTDNRDISETIDRDTTDTGTIHNETWERGNIGIMSTQDLIKQQREVVQFNIIDFIINDFKNRFCLLIY